MNSSLIAAVDSASLAGAPAERRSPTASAATATSGASRSANERLCHLFRASLREGRIHPLYLPILNYRHAGQDR